MNIPQLRTMNLFNLFDLLQYYESIDKVLLINELVNITSIRALAI